MKKETNQMLHDKISRLIIENNNYQTEVTRLIKEKESVMNNHVIQARDDAQKARSLQETIIANKNEIIILKNDIEKEKNITRYEAQGREKELNDKLYNSEKLIRAMIQNQSNFIQTFAGIYL